MMNEQFPAAEIREKIKALQSWALNPKLKMRIRHQVPGELRRVMTTLVDPVAPTEHIESTDTESDEKEL